MITKYSELTIADFQALKQVERDTFELPIDKEIAVLSILSGGTIEMLEGLPKYKLNEIAHQTSFFKQPLPEKLRNDFRIGFKRYKIELRAQNITAEQFILLNKYTTSESTIIENLHYTLAVLSYEKKLVGLQRFDKDFEDKAQRIQKELTIDIAYPVAVFFWAVYQSWLEATKTYLVKKAKNIKTKAEMRLKEIQK